jgi:hypothetical protein
MIHFKLFEYLAQTCNISPGYQIMDIGTQNILFVEKDAALRLVKSLRRTSVTAAEEIEVDRICYFSTPRAGERTAFLHELLALTDVVYESVDIVDGLKTTILDLNRDAPPSKWVNQFDMVINCGTLEHVIHQYNAISFIHAVIKTGGLWFEQPPSVGFLNHGYFNYNPLFYLDVGKANGYELLQGWYSPAGMYPVTDIRFPVVSVDKLHEPAERQKALKKPFSDTATRPEEQAASYNFNCLMRKTQHAPLRLPLEIRTTHGPVGKEVENSYGSFIFDSTCQK